MASSLCIGSRGSTLARWQARFVGEHLTQAGYPVRYVNIRTAGDQQAQAPFTEIGTQGIFTKALEDALHTKEIDIAVHSAKDLPASTPEGLCLLAFTARELPHDVLLTQTGAAWSTIPPSAPPRIGTSSARRCAQLLHYFPQSVTVPLRGNVQTRIASLSKGQCDAIVLAYAAVLRCNYTHLISQSLHPTYFVPAVGQGCLAVEVSKKMAKKQQQAIRRVINHAQSELCLRTERAFLREIGGGCHIPVFGHAIIEKKTVHLHAGRYHEGVCLQQKRSGAITNPEQLGKMVATHVLELMSKFSPR